jgi:hypothetical protein
VDSEDDVEEGAKTTLRRIFAGDGEDEDEEEEDEDEENSDGDRRRSDPSGAGGLHSVIQQQRGKRGSSTVDDSSITCSCGREYEHEKAGTYMQRVVDADMASLAAMRRELGDAFDPCGLLIESDFQPGQVGYDVQTVIRMLVQAAPTLSEDTEPMRSAYQSIRDKADAMVYSFLAMAPGVPTLGAYNTGFYTSVAFVIPEGVRSGIHSFRAAFDLQETQGKNTRVTLRGCQTITICTE